MMRFGSRKDEKTNNFPLRVTAKSQNRKENFTVVRLCEFKNKVSFFLLISGGDFSRTAMIQR